MTKCSIDGCDNTARARGWCSTHWLRWRKHGDPTVSLRRHGRGICSMEACGKKVNSRGLCSMHYYRLRVWGSTEGFAPKRSEEQRFWGYVEKSDGCWNWTGGRLATGYGRFFTFRDGKRATVYAHRYVYELAVGPIPDRLTIDHLCLNTSCVNPEHLEVVTRAENARRGLIRRPIDPVTGRFLPLAEPS